MPHSLQPLIQYTHLLIQAFAFALCVDVVDVGERTMDKPALIGIHRFKQNRSFGCYHRRIR